MAIKKLIVKPCMSDANIAQMEGEHFDQTYFDTIIDYDADVYTIDGKLLLKFRKNVISKSLTDLALNAYRKKAKVKNNNRGASAGVLDINKLPKFVKELHSDNKFRTSFIKSDGTVSKTRIGNLSRSNIAGYFDTPNRNSWMQNSMPCRLTSFTKHNNKLWVSSLPFLIKCDRLFQSLTPDNHFLQWCQANQTPDYNIAGTAFSTITINYSWRTALHRDANDFKDGFGNLIIIEDDENPNKYLGCYTGFPQYKVAVDVRTGDFLAMDVHQWHCNTEFIPVNNPNDEQLFNRLAVVCYLRDGMIKCANKDIDRDALIRTYDGLYK